MSSGLCAGRGQARGSPYFSHCSDPAGSKLCPGPNQALSRLEDGLLCGVLDRLASMVSLYVPCWLASMCLFPHS